ncbi:flagellar hook protein FlgE [Rhodospirillaceae bacterium SYSU D60014]|uniref:flagellar hook protein FlgE n=1 Tax=Virgifigura deserti TaxID=2268457 RepID=UPI000E666011
MSLMGAMRAGVAGLQAQSTKFAAIADNISNSSTVGYKRAEVQFTSMVTQPPTQTSYTSGGVLPSIRQEIGKAGTLLPTSSSTDLAIAGGGFFVVADHATAADRSFALTRAGSFVPDDAGNLVNSAGYYLQGFELNADGTPVIAAPSTDTFNDLETVNINNLTFAGSPTTRIDFSANLPAGAPGPGGTGQVQTTSTTYYDPLGTPRRLTLEWTPDAATDNQWTLNVIDYDGTNIGTVDILFNGVADPNPGMPMTYTPAMPTGVLGLTNVDGQPIDLDIGAVNTPNGIVQFDGDYQPEIHSDGAQLGVLQRVEVDKEGVVYAIFNNGERTPIYQVPLAAVPNPNGLTSDDGNIFRLGQNSGQMYLWEGTHGPAGEVVASALEASNVDIAEELTQLIQTQRAYSSNAKIFQTGDEMMAELSQLKR